MAEPFRIVLIPAYRPQEELLSLISELRARDFSLVVVDDGSGEAYESIFRQAQEQADVVSYPGNKGKGEALKTGISYIREHFEAPYIIVTADADGQHRPADIEKVFLEAKEYPDSLVLGSRGFDKDVPLRNKTGNAITRFVFRLSSGVSVYDTQTGLRAFSDRLADKMLEISGSRYEYEMNVLMVLAREKIAIREVRIETVYLNGNESSHFHVVKDSYRIYKEILKFSLSSLLSFLVDYGLFCLFSALTGKLVVSNVAARIISGTVNFTLNRRLVFQQKTGAAKSAVEYILLAVFILACNTGILKLLTMAGVGAYFAKILTELVLFVFSWFVQHSVIFRRERES